jgi:hypothetical protein
MLLRSTLTPTTDWPSGRTVALVTAIRLASGQAGFSLNAMVALGELVQKSPVTVMLGKSQFSTVTLGDTPDMVGAVTFISPMALAMKGPLGPVAL